MKIGIVILLLLFFLPPVWAAEYVFNQISVSTDMEKKFEEFYINLRCLAGKMDRLEMVVVGPMRATDADGSVLRTEVLPRGHRIYFEKPVLPGESYAFNLSFDLEARYLEENTLYYRSFSFPRDVREFVLSVKLPMGVFPEVSTKELAGEIASWKTATTLPPNEIAIEKERVTLIWTKSLKANERFEVGLIYPERKFNQYLLLIPVALFLLFLAFKKKMPRVFLTEEEIPVWKFICSRGGKALQEEIWKAESISFSRPKVSKIIADLEKKGLIRREPYKKTFKVFIVKS